MMKFINNLKLNARLNILIITLVFIVFTIFGVYLYYNQKSKIGSQVEKNVDEQLNDLSKIIDTHIKEKKEKVTSFLKTTNYILANNHFISMADTLQTEIILSKSDAGELSNLILPQLNLDNIQLYNNFSFVDNIQSLIDAPVAIYQKYDQGFVSLSTNIQRPDQSRALGNVILFDNPIGSALKDGKPYIGRVNISGKMYICAAKPIDLNGEIVAMLMVATDEVDKTFLKGIFEEKLFYQTGYPFLISEKGKFIIEPNEGYTYLKENSQIIKDLMQEETGHFNYKTANGRNKQIYFKYLQPIKGYIAVDFYEKEIFSGLPQLRTIIIIGFLAIVLLLFVGITAVTKPIKKILNKLMEVIGLMSKGQITEKIEYNKQDEIGKIIGSLNHLIEGLKETAYFANEIGKGHLDTGFTPLSEEDVLGNSLLEMRKSLKEAKIEEEKRKIEDEKANWATKGQAMFGDILRQNNDNLKKLSYEIIRNLVKYTGVNQGALFLLNDEEESSKFLEMTACYAYERKKYIDRKLEPGEGLVGACFAEGKTKYLKETPDDYVYITSGLGYATPTEILMVPLNLNEDTFGVIELAGFENFEKYKIDFVEKIGENVASTISSVKINLRTSQLLEKSQEQAEALKSQEEEMRQNMEELQVAKEEAARQGEQLESITNTVNHTLVRAEYDTNGILLYCNTKFLNKLGYSSYAEVEGKHISTFIHEKDRDWFFKIWDKLARGGKHFEGDMKHVTKQGKDFWSMATYTCVRTVEGNVDKILFLGIDTTEQKKQNLDYQWQIDALNHSSIKAEFMLDGSLIDWNSRFRKALGFLKDDELRGKGIFDFIFDEEMEQAKTIWKNLVAGKPYEGQIRLDSNKGEKWFHVTISAVKDMYGEVSKIIYIGNDTTRQKQMEREVKKMKIRNEKTLEGMLDAILTINEHGKISFFNKAAEELWGFMKSEVLGKNITDLLPTEITSDPNFFENFIVKGVGSRNEIKIVNNENEKIPVLILFSEAKVADERTFTAFIQKIEVELF